METGILHTHHLIVVLYMIQLLVKVVIVISGNTNALTSIQAKTKVLHIVLATLMLVTGIFLMIKAPAAYSTSFIIKYAAVLAAIGLGVVGVKKMNKVMAVGSLVCMIYVYALATTKSHLLQPEETKVKNALLQAGTDSKVRGQVIYEQLCLRCHGADAKANYRKALTLANCNKGDDFIKAMVANGAGKMPAFAFLNEDEKNDLVVYINSMIKK